MPVSLDFAPGDGPVNEPAKLAGPKFHYSCLIFAESFDQYAFTVTRFDVDMDHRNHRPPAIS
jgi:hypothetical protein